MSNEEITVSLEKRKIVGKGLNKLKADGKIPAVIHDHGKDSVIVAGNFMDLSKVYDRAGKSHPVNLDVDGEDYFAIIKEADFDPKRGDMRHIVFSTIKRGEKVTAEVPIVITGEIPAERAGLIVLRTIDKVEIEAIPKNLVDQLEVEGLSLKEVGDKLHISDITLPEGVEILAEDEQTIVTIDQPRAVEEPEPSEAEGEEGEEGEGGESSESDSSEASTDEKSE